MVRYLTNRIVFNKLETIYRTIHHQPVTTRQFKEEFSERDMIGKIQEDVQHWAEEKTLEISQLKQMEKYRREFLGNVSHELKTPIFNIQGYILTLLEGGIDDSNINKLYLQRAEKSINRMISIVEDLESISRLESGTFKLDFTRFDLVRLVEEVFENLEMYARKKNISLHIKRSSLGSALWVKADKKRIFEVISNLVINSINYGKESGKTIVSFKDGADHITVFVTDNGIGIPQKDMPRIFERFYRVDQSRSRNLGGTGLGLAIVKHVIEAHNGTLRVNSRWHEGSEFSFTLEKG
ncbi:MAG: sensor histidine kinase [Chlorobi bacterium]|nr:sensor histidine kinase [Chlorobiota bacterium]